MNPNLDRNKCYLRVGKTMFGPADENGQRTDKAEYVSINEAKKESRRLMKMGQTVLTKA